MNENDIRTLAIELCELTPMQLDAYVLGFLKLPYSSQMHVSDMDTLAEAILQHESLGDAIARCQRYEEVQ